MDMKLVEAQATEIRETLRTMADPAREPGSPALLQGQGQVARDWDAGTEEAIAGVREGSPQESWFGRNIGDRR